MHLVSPQIRYRKIAIIIPCYIIIKLNSLVSLITYCKVYLQKFLGVIMKALLLLITCSLYLFANEAKVETKHLVYTFNKSELNSAIKEHLPYEIDYLFVFNIKLLDASTDFSKTAARLSTVIDSNVSMYLGETKSSFEAHIEMSSGIEYFASRDSLYLKNPSIENIVVPEIDTKYMQMVSSAITTALLSYYKNHPVYVLSEAEKKEIAHDIENVSIENRELRVTLKP